MKRFAASLPLLLSAALSLAAAADPIVKLPPREKRWAVVIGVDRYDDPDFTLKGGAKDAQTLRDALVEVAGFPPDQVLVLATAGPPDHQPTRTNLVRRIFSHLRGVPHDGLFVLAFSGHGIERGGEVYLFPADVNPGEAEGIVQANALTVGMIRNEIEANEIAQVVFFVNACRNDPAGRTGSANKMTQAFIDRFRFDVQSNVKAYAALFAASTNQRAYEYREKRQGYFTWAVVEGLRGAAANDRGEVTLQGLAEYVANVVPQRVAADLGNDQVPDKEIRGYGDSIVLAVVPEKAARTAPVPAVPDAIELRFWESVEKLNTREAYEEYLRRYPHGIWARVARFYTTAAPHPAAPAAFSPAQAEQAIARGEYGRARTILEKGAAAGDVGAKTELGRLLYLCLGGPCDYPGARKLLDEAAKGGSRDAEGWLALMTILYGGDVERAIRYTRSERTPFAQVVLGIAHEDGVGVPHDMDEANRLYRLALPELQTRAGRGDPWAQNLLAVCYNNGNAGLEPDDRKIIELLQAAVDHGLPAAMVTLGESYAAGQGVPRNYTRARSLYRAAADLDFPRGMFLVGWMYDSGWGVQKDAAIAADWYRRAAEMGSTSAMNRFAWMHEHGFGGLAKDVSKAVEWYRKSAALGDRHAKEQLTRLGY